MKFDYCATNLCCLGSSYPTLRTEREGWGTEDLWYPRRENPTWGTQNF
jgi:hypothetical protein